ncbi:MAG TPA: ABC transporter ATP-binding protein [Cyclobacteriaceae bacterium]
MTIQVENLGKRFNREWIFKNLTSRFEQGNTYAITGPNGSGKSTLLQVLWGQMPASSGKISYQLKDKAVVIEDVFQHVSIATPYMDLIEEYTLEEMIRFHFQFKKVRQSKSVTELMELMELTHARDKVISNFSSGMRQRVKLGLAFFSDTPMLFLDEPTTNLDKKSTEWYLKYLYQLPADSLIFIASNQEHEYPVSAKKIDILSFK